MTDLPPFRLLVTGARETTQAQNEFVWDTLTGLYRKIGNERPIIIVHGKCPSGGVDKAADDWARMPWDNVTPEPHPANWDEGRGAGPRRNAHMVSLGAHTVVAFPGPGSRRTWDCLQKAVNAGIRPYLFPLHIYVKES